MAKSFCVKCGHSSDVKTRGLFFASVREIWFMINPFVLNPHRIVRRVVMSVLLLLGLLLSNAAMAQVDLTLDLSAPPAATTQDTILGYGGGVWRIPRVFPWVEPRILELPRLGTFRAALAWEVLAASDSLDDLDRRLHDYRLNDFLSRAHARGARIVITLDAMPRWLAADRSDKRLADGPVWAKSPPRDYRKWAAVVRKVVEHFNGHLGLDAWYEVWNEPDHAWRGTMDEFFRLYQASTEGAHQGDPKARIGGPAVSSWAAIGTQRDPGDVKKGFFIQRWLTYAAVHKLPVDFITWHGFYRQPDEHYRRVVPRIRAWVAQAGMDALTPLLVSEWNIAAEPPYPEGDLNGNYVGAAFVAGSLIAMQRAGLDGQVFQMMVDPGQAGYSGGTFTAFGLPRANFQTFELAARLSGATLPVQSTDRWVSAVARRDGKTVRVLIATLRPTPMMRLRTEFENLPLSQPDLLAELPSMNRKKLLGYFRNGKLPGGVSSRMKKFLMHSREQMTAYKRRSIAWDAGQTVVLHLRGLHGGMGHVVRYRLDADTSIDPAALQQAQSHLLRVAKEALSDASSYLARTDLPTSLQQRFSREMQRSFHISETLSKAHGLSHDLLVEARNQVYEKYGTAQAQAVAKVETGPVAQRLRPVTDVSFHVAPVSVDLVEIKLP